MNWVKPVFDRPEYLFLLLLLIPIAIMGRKSLSGMTFSRRMAAIALRLGVATMIILALADLQILRITDRIATFFLLDQSLSLSVSQRESALNYARAAVEEHRDRAKGDMAGVIVFGGDAQVESPLHRDGYLPTKIESRVDDHHTNIASSLRLAQAAFPDGVSKRVVLISEGNQNLGDAMAEGRALSESGVGIDVAPLPHRARGDVLVEKVATPAGTRSGVPFDVRVVLSNTLPEGTPDGEIAGKITVLRKTNDSETIIAQQDIAVPPGKHIFTFRQELTDPHFYTYEARFAPKDTAADGIPQNNRATAFTHLQGRGHVLFIVNSESPHDFDHLIERLQAQDIQVTKQTTDTLFTTLASLQAYDSVILANTPRTSGNEADDLKEFSDEQIDILVKNTEQLGAGLIMLGGPDSFGAGGWSNTKLEAAMPIDFTVKNSQVVASGALMLVIDRSGSMEGDNKLAMCKEAAKAAVSMLGPHDQIGVITFDFAETENVKLQKVGNQRSLLQKRIDRIASGGGTNMEPAMRRGYDALRRSNAAVKHMVIMTDGQTAGSNYETMASQNHKLGITTTSLAIGADADQRLLQAIASRGGGKFYKVTNPRALPKVFSKETRRVVRPLIFELEAGFQPQIAEAHEVLSGIEQVPPLTGFVLTTLKDNPLVEVPIISPKPGDERYAILATWTYGLGRSAAFTTDGGRRWAKAWPEWASYDRLFVQLVRWSMRPLGNEGALDVVAEVSEGKLRVVVNGVTAEGEFLNNLNLEGALISDRGQSTQSIGFEQVAPGRYIAETTIAEAGSYMLAVSPGGGKAPLRVGVNVPYSPEFRETSANENLLVSLSQLAPRGGKPGEVIRLPDETSEWPKFTGPDIYRRDLPRGRTLTSLWPLIMVIACIAFLLDIGNRRLLWSFPKLATIARWLPWSKRATDDAAPVLARLQSRRESALADHAAARYTLSDAAVDSPPPNLGDPLQNASPSPTLSPLTPTVAPEAQDPDNSYTARLLQAKKEAKEKRM